MDRASSKGIDEGSLTKGQLRKLTALRKSVGGRDRRAHVRHVVGVAGNGRQEGRRERGDDHRHSVAPSRAGRSGDPARRLLAATRPRSDHRRGRAAVERPRVVRRVRAPFRTWEILVGADASDDGRGRHQPSGKCLHGSPLRRGGAGTSPACLGAWGRAPRSPHVRSIMRTIVLTLLLGVALFVPAAAKEDDRLATIHLPEGFVIEPFAKVPNARQMAWGEKGTLFVGTRRDGACSR